jgi:hypothetical protein
VLVYLADNYCFPKDGLVRRKWLLNEAREMHGRWGGELAALAKAEQPADDAMRRLRKKPGWEAAGGGCVRRPADAAMRAKADAKAKRRESVGSKGGKMAAVVEKEVGRGKEIVYCYTFPAYRRPRGDGRMRIKIGQTGCADVGRVVAQCGTAHPEEPVVLLIIRTDASRDLERGIHGILRFRQQQAVGTRGREWFWTTVDEVLELRDLLDKTR